MCTLVAAGATAVYPIDLVMFTALPVAQPINLSLYIIILINHFSNIHYTLFIHLLTCVQHGMTRNKLQYESINRIVPNWVQNDTTR